MFRRGRRLDLDDPQSAPQGVPQVEEEPLQPAVGVSGEAEEGPRGAGDGSATPTPVPAIEELRAQLEEAQRWAAGAEDELEHLRAQLAELQAGAPYQAPAMASTGAAGSAQYPGPDGGVLRGPSGADAISGDAMLSALSNSLDQAKEESIRLLAAATKEAEDLLSAVVVTFERESAMIRAAREQAERDSEKATAVRAEAERDAEIALSARREAELALQQARAEAQRVVDEARSEAERIVEQGRQESGRLVEHATERAAQTLGQARSEMETVRQHFADQVTELRRAMDVANLTLDRFISSDARSGEARSSETPGEARSSETPGEARSSETPDPSSSGPAVGATNGVPRGPSDGVPNGIRPQPGAGPAPPSEAGLGTL